MQLLDGSERKSQFTRLRENFNFFSIIVFLVGKSKGVRCTVIRFCHIVSSECFIRLITVSNFQCCSNANCVARKITCSLYIAGRGLGVVATFAAASESSL